MIDLPKGSILRKNNRPRVNYELHIKTILESNYFGDEDIYRLDRFHVYNYSISSLSFNLKREDLLDSDYDDDQHYIHSFPENFFDVSKFIYATKVSKKIVNYRTFHRLCSEGITSYVEPVYCHEEGSDVYRFCFEDEESLLLLKLRGILW